MVTFSFQLQIILKVHTSTVTFVFLSSPHSWCGGRPPGSGGPPLTGGGSGGSGGGGEEKEGHEG